MCEVCNWKTKMYTFHFNNFFLYWSPGRFLWYNLLRNFRYFKNMYKYICIVMDIALHKSLKYLNLDDYYINNTWLYVSKQITCVHVTRNGINDNIPLVTWTVSSSILREVFSTFSTTGFFTTASILKKLQYF
jgi:hypothetical protein